MTQATGSRVLIDSDPYSGAVWPCSWVCCANADRPPFVTAYRVRFTLSCSARIRCHVSADERYDMFVDGQRIGRGSERGDPMAWYFETYDLLLSAGPHVVVARVWSLGQHAPVAQMSSRAGFLLSPHDAEHVALLGTGVADWDAKRLDGYSFVDSSIRKAYFAVGARAQIDGMRFPWGFETGSGADWYPAQTLTPGSSTWLPFGLSPTHFLKPATLPPMLDEPCATGTVRIVSDVATIDVESLRIMPIHLQADLVTEREAWQAFIHFQKPLVIPPHTRRRILLDLEDYFCAYASVTASNGAGSCIRIGWAEALFLDTALQHKGHRSEIDAKYLATIADEYVADGGQDRRFEPLWWNAGRYLELVLQTADDPLTLVGFDVCETRYPLEPESTFTSDDPRLAAVIDPAIRTLQMCSHETFMDCPYYEQLMYVGDARIEALLTYVLTRDDRLARKALQLFDGSRLASGLTRARHPSRDVQVIAPFSLWWVCMVYDYALWRGDPTFVCGLMPGVRAVIDYFCMCLSAEGLVQALEGWTFADWVPDWRNGIPPDGDVGNSGIINWQFALALNYAAQLEIWAGQPELAARAKRQADALTRRLTTHFWSTDHGLFTDNLSKSQFSEHSQALALLSGGLAPHIQRDLAERLCNTPTLTQTTAYFTHYLFEAYAATDHIESLLQRLHLWFDMSGSGLKTLLELPEPSRSDCHAWSTHPVYHYFTSILGIRPSSMGFTSVIIRPQFGTLHSIEGSLVHTSGTIQVYLELTKNDLGGTIILPDGLTGELAFNGKRVPLSPGKQTIMVDSRRNQ